MLRKTIDLRPALFACAVLLLIGCQSTSTSPNATLADEATAASVDALLAAAAAAERLYARRRVAADRHRARRARVVAPRA